jgi:hypothetical protein
MNDPNMTLVEAHDELKMYSRLSDKLSIGDAKLKAIDYVIYKNRFCGLSVKAKGIMNFTGLKDAVFAYYGEGKQENEYIKKWVWLPEIENSNVNVRLTLEYNEFSEETLLTMGYIPILEEIAADDAKKAKESSKDF